MATGRLIGVGVGPVDPGLLTLNAIAALNAADVIAHFAKFGNASNARTTVLPAPRFAPTTCRWHDTFPGGTS